jgi:hypothetical protein
MEDADVLMHEGGVDAPTVFDVAEKLAQQDFEKEACDSDAVILERAQNQVEKDRTKVAKKFAQQAKLAKVEKRGRGPQHGRTGADKVKNKGPAGAPVEVDPALAVAVIPKPGARASNEPGADEGARGPEVILTDLRHGTWLAFSI